MSDNPQDDITCSSSSFSMLSRRELQALSSNGNSELTAPLSKLDLTTNVVILPDVEDKPVTKAHETIDDNSWAMVDSSAQKQKNSNTAGIVCPKCTLLSSRDDDKKLAAFLQEQEGGELYDNAAGQENNVLHLRPGPSEVLFQHARILANDILAAIQLEVESELDKPPQLGKGAHLKNNLCPLPADNFTTLVSHFMDHYYFHPATTEESNERKQIELCYCVTHDRETTMIQHRGFGSSRAFASTPDGALALFEFDNLPEYKKALSDSEIQNNLRKRERKPRIHDRLQRMCERRRVVATTIQPNTTAWIVLVSSPLDDDEEPDFQAAVRTANNEEIQPSMIFHRSHSLPLVSFPVEMIHQDSLTGSLSKTLSNLCRESFGGFLPTTKEFSTVEVTGSIPGGTHSPGWSSIKQSDRILPKLR